MKTLEELGYSIEEKGEGYVVYSRKVKIEQGMRTESLLFDFELKEVKGYTDQGGKEFVLDELKAIAAILEKLE